ncbi:TPA: hypothetical protein L4R50_000411 [Pseudomonas aeruginosa]|nr:hypothetical protein [Pseudomonas aeruginosa]HBP1602316.1 hypothetical protein [Pseudomonas aeruginosa]
MDLSNVLPRYGTREHRQLGLLLVTLLVVALVMLMPDFAFAAFDGTIKPDEKVAGNLDSSGRSWWRFFAKPGFWIAMFWLAGSVLFFSSRGWQLPFVLGAIFLFGEMVVDGFQALMK